MTLFAIVEYLLLVVLLIAAIFIIVAVVFQKTGEDGLSSTLAGGQETYYGKDKSMRKDKLLGKWTLIVAIVFALIVLVVYVIQPDYPFFENGIDSWQNVSGISEFSYIFS